MCKEDNPVNMMIYKAPLWLYTTTIFFTLIIISTCRVQLSEDKEKNSTNKIDSCQSKIQKAKVGR